MNQSIEKMFCFQCQETAKGSGCTQRGVCGKPASTSAMMDLLLFATRGVAVVSSSLHDKEITQPPGVAHFVMSSLFATITNANFDEAAILGRVRQGFALRDELIALAVHHKLSIPQVDEVTWKIPTAGCCCSKEGTLMQDCLQKAYSVGVMREQNEDIRSLKELVIYGLKGMSAYYEHAYNLGFEDKDIAHFVLHTLSDLAVINKSTDELLALVMETGSYGVKAMELLDRANTSTYGHPEITQVSVDVRSNPSILISGHDLHDLEQLLIQTQGTGVDVYTHSEMLPGHYYPQLKKYPHLVGNYGSSWWHQREDFTSFNGPILFTTNCIVPPLDGAVYKDRIFTTNAAGYPGCKHIMPDKNGEKDFSPIIALAKQCLPPTRLEQGTITGGFAHNQVVQLADKVVEAVRSGAIRKFIVMAGCDGRMKSREYYTEFARQLPSDTVILTAGCAKYRYNKLNLGIIGGIPRVLDAGQCNDSYSLALIALELKGLFGLDDINELPIVYNIAWYEQKAVIVLLALLSLGVKNIHLGPTLPAFLSPNVLNILVDRFHVGTISTPEQDLASWIG